MSVKNLHLQVLSQACKTVEDRLDFTPLQVLSHPVNQLLHLIKF